MVVVHRMYPSPHSVASVCGVFFIVYFFPVIFHHPIRAGTAIAVDWLWKYIVADAVYSGTLCDG